MYVFISIFLTSLLVPLILRFIVFKSQSSQSSLPYTFKYPRFLAVFFLIGIFAIVALCVAAYLLDNEERLELYIFLLPFYALFTIAVTWQFLKALNFQLILEEDFILYRNLFGIIRKIKYEEISKIKAYNDKSHNPIKYRIYIGNRRIVVDNFTVNFNDFPNIMKKRLRKAKNTIQFV